MAGKVRRQNSVGVSAFPADSSLPASPTEYQHTAPVIVYEFEAREKFPSSMAMMACIPRIGQGLVPFLQGHALP